MAGLEDRAVPTIVGRSSSHFTRVTRIFAAEVGVSCSFQIVRDLTSSDPHDYGGNPALKLPTLRTSLGSWFGSLPICRELARLSRDKPRVVWPEDLDVPLLANAQELVVQAMSTEVGLIMAKVAGGPESGYQAKMAVSLANAMAWLEAHARSTLSALPAERDLSYLEVTLYCLVTHLAFRDVLPVLAYPQLDAFCARFGERESAKGTVYAFDA